MPRTSPLGPPLCAHCQIVQDDTNSARRPTGISFRSLCRTCESAASLARYRARRDTYNRNKAARRATPEGQAARRAERQRAKTKGIT
ncbi:hypothetical protein SEA_MORGANA_70 [Gordonia phage Morgana]|uniref:HNH endonuclease n=1 Tax=Gordonia phage Morgana TaxID=3137292 RepID=A0AAX4RAQ6_9CAUD